MSRFRGSGEPEAYSVTVPKGYRVGDWEVCEPLAAGAFGSVYAARRRTATNPGLRQADPELPQAVALKFLPTGTRTPRQLRHLKELAEREVELLSRLRAPRLIRMYEALTVDDPDHPELDGAPVLVLEKAEQSLDALLARSAKPESGPTLLAQVCEGLHQLHHAGWVHGDLKPANVLLMKDGSARLADFNLAAELEGTHAYNPAFSTPDYTPPELLWSEIGERGQQIRPTADVWAFGVLAHVVLTGSLPLTGATPSARREAAVRYARGLDELRLSAELPDAWREIITGCLSRTHLERAAYDAASLLRRVEAAAGTTASPRLRPARPLSRSRRVWAATATVLAAGVTALALTLGGDPDPGGQDRPVSTQVGESPASGEPVVAGYDRCLEGSVCFFTEKDGKGDMCAWEGDDVDWARGENKCSWTTTRQTRSFFNNGLGADNGEEFVDVAYYAKTALREHLACVERGTRGNLPEPLRPRSHSWVVKC